jgi:hypothetical protein
MMKNFLIGSFILLLSSSAFSISEDKDLFVSITSSVHAGSGTVTERLAGTLALNDGIGTNSFIAVSSTNSGYIYFSGRDAGVNFSCYVHESVKSAAEMENYRAIAAAFTNGSRIAVTKFGHVSTCGSVYLKNNSWQHLN